LGGSCFAFLRYPLDVCDIPVTLRLPGIFSLDQSGAAPVYFNQDGSINTVLNPAKRGDIVFFTPPALARRSRRAPPADRRNKSAVVLHNLCQSRCCLEARRGPDLLTMDPRLRSSQA